MLSYVLGRDVFGWDLGGWKCREMKNSFVWLRRKMKGRKYVFYIYFYVPITWYIRNNWTHSGSDNIRPCLDFARLN